MRTNLIRIGLITLIALLFSGCDLFKKEKASMTVSHSEKRTTANNRVPSPDELRNQAGFATFRDQFTAISEVDQLDSFLGSLQTKEYDRSMLDQESLTLILARETIRLSRVTKGLFYRMRNVVAEHNISRAAVVSTLRMSVAGIDTFLPNSQWQAGFDYVTQPFYKRAQNEEFDIDNDEEFKTYLVNEVAPMLENYLNVLNFLLENVETNKLYWDNIFLNRNFTNVNPDRYTELGRVELKLMKASTLLGLASIQSTKAYSLNGLFEMVDDVSKKFGIGVVFRPADAIAEKRNRIIKNAIDNGFLAKAPNLSDAEFRQTLETAYNLTVNGVKEAEEAWEIFRDEERDYDKFLKAQAAIPFTRIINASLQNIKIVTGKADTDTIVSVVSQGEQISFNIKKFFIDEPITGEAGNSFKDFMPTGYNNESEFLTVNVDGQTVRYRNFRQGNPNQWNQDIYQKYFGTGDTRLVSRVLAQSWGTGGLALLFLPVIM